MYYVHVFCNGNLVKKYPCTKRNMQSVLRRAHGDALLLAIASDHKDEYTLYIDEA
jgi:hypothetical protein